MQNKLKSEEIALRIRRRVFEHCIKNNGAYLSQACSSAEQLAWLYNEALNIGDSTMPSIPESFSGVPSINNKSIKLGLVIMVLLPMNMIDLFLHQLIML